MRVIEFADNQGVRLGAIWPLAFWPLDDDLDQELAGLDFRLVAVLKHPHFLHGWAGEPVPGELGDLLVQMIQLSSVHIRLPRSACNQRNSRIAEYARARYWAVLYVTKLVGSGP